MGFGKGKPGKFDLIGEEVVSVMGALTPERFSFGPPQCQEISLRCDRVPQSVLSINRTKQYPRVQDRANDLLFFASTGGNSVGLRPKATLIRRVLHSGKIVTNQVGNNSITTPKKVIVLLWKFSFRS